MKNYRRDIESPASKFKAFCEQRGFSCRFFSAGGRRDRIHAKRLFVGDVLVDLRQLSRGELYYKIHPASPAGPFVAYAIPDSEDWLVLPREMACKATSFSLAPDLDRATYTQRHIWASYVNNLEQLPVAKDGCHS